MQIFRRVVMKEIQDMVKADHQMMEELEKGDQSEEVRKWKEHAMDKRTDKFQGERATGKAQANDATKAYATMKNIAGRGLFTSSVQLSYFGSKRMEEFMVEKFKMTCFEFCQAAEALCCRGLVLFGQCRGRKGAFIGFVEAGYCRDDSDWASKLGIE
ncbi:hypothetical protein D9758_015351 [Tetrapyrgos nigripes]|uniref:Uncharacterized protein n=1 Tax=Tetrapyrgos nigripes TaxID=182062 RepID=A0A8H5FPC3_9AGAR|nr:hypothetical protein D9758_015351 [Tetrapyrgos nigripes]